MTSRVDSVGLSGISGYPVMVECSISSGLPEHLSEAIQYRTHQLIQN